MDDYMSKPVKPDVLRHKLERWATTAASGNGFKVKRMLDEPVPQGRADIIDQAQLAGLRAIQLPGFLVELIDLFLEEVAAHLADLRAAVVKEDPLEIKRLAHCLKGSCANMGATQMSVLAQELEAREAKDLLAELELEFELVREALNAERPAVEGEHSLRPVPSTTESKSLGLD
jgi:HPt (histidine-containing phosphotransfer) domain-containing protein